MRPSSLLLLLSQLVWVAAFGDAGAYERLMYYYAYTLDGTPSQKIAVGCRGPRKKGSRCTFREFMEYIEHSDDNKKLIPTALSDKLDPFDIDRAVQALQDGHYTGTYDASRIYVDIKENDNVSGLMQRIAGFLEGKIGEANAGTQAALQKVTRDLAAQRLKARGDSLSERLKREIPDIVIHKKDYAYLGVDYPQHTIQTPDLKPTYLANTALVSSDRWAQIMAAWQRADAPGHEVNIKAARDCAVKVDIACGNPGSAGPA